MCLRQRMGDYIREIVVDEWPEIFGPIAISILEPVQHCLGYDVLLIILIAAAPASQGVPALRNKWSRHEAGVHEPKRIPVQCRHRGIEMTGREAKTKICNGISTVCL